MAHSLSTITIHLRKYWYTYCALGTTLAAGIIVCLIFRNQLNPDGVSYFQIANSYAALDLGRAINGYWSPLLSWLLTPLAWLKVDLLLGYRLLSLVLTLALVGVSGYITSILFQNPTRLQQTNTFLYLSILGVTVVTWGSSVITPDVLSGTVLAACCAITFLSTKHPNKALYSFMLGAGLALLYFSKSIGFYIALAILCFIFIYNHRNNVSHRPFSIALVTFLSISCLWIGGLFLKYNQITISTSGTYNTALQGPAHPEHPQTQEGYLPTKYLESTWAWDDPSSFKLPEWNKLANVWYFKFHFIETLSESISLFLSITPLVFFGFFTLILTRNSKISLVGYMLLISTALTLLAYSYILYTEERYIWLVAIPFAAYGVLSLYYLKQQKPLFVILCCMLAASLIQTANLYQNSDSRIQTEAAIKSLSQSAAPALTMHAKTAGPYPSNYMICFFAKLQCVGNYTLSGNYNKDIEKIEIMRTHGIVYYADFSDSALSYLPLVFEKSYPTKHCFDQTTGKNTLCKSMTLRVYKLQ